MKNYSVSLPNCLVFIRCSQQASRNLESQGKTILHVIPAKAGMTDVAGIVDVR